jgi:thiol-disulfide isomerase/thioredoxin
MGKRCSPFRAIIINTRAVLSTDSFHLKIKSQSPCVHLQYPTRTTLMSPVSFFFPYVYCQPLSLEELDAILENSSQKLVVIDFYADDCPPCAKVAPLFVELSRLEEFVDNVVFVKVHVHQQPAITARYQVTGWPTFVFIKEGNQVVTEIVGGNLAEATLYDWIRLLVPKNQPEN